MIFLDLGLRPPKAQAITRLHPSGFSRPGSVTCTFRRLSWTKTVCQTKKPTFSGGARAENLERSQKIHSGWSSFDVPVTVVASSKYKSIQCWGRWFRNIAIKNWRFISGHWSSHILMVDGQIHGRSRMVGTLSKGIQPFLAKCQKKAFKQYNRINVA